MRPFHVVSLRTERLLLRPLRATDAADLFAMYADPRVVRYWNNAPWTSMDQARAMIAKDTAELPAGEHLRLGLELTSEARMIGTCSLFQFSEQNRRAEFGYAMASPMWGKGYMHEALTALVEYAFGELDLHRLEADVDPRNAASVRSLERLGFQREGLLRERWIVAGEVSDTGFYGLLRSDWRARTGA